MLRQIDEICLQEGVYPHAVLSAHAHNYQRYTRIMKFGGHEIEFLSSCAVTVATTSIRSSAQEGADGAGASAGSRVDIWSGQKLRSSQRVVLEKYNDTNYGYLRIHVDKEQLRIGFHQVGASTLAQSRYDMVTLDLAEQIMVSN